MIAAKAHVNIDPEKIKGVLARVATGLYNGVEQAAIVVETEAKSLAPVDTGNLRDSIGHQVFRGIQQMMANKQSVRDSMYLVTGIVAAQAFYASFVEFGTGITGAGTYPYPLPGEGVPITGSWIYDYKKQNWHGMIAQPYMLPALDTTHAAQVAAIRNGVEAELR